MGKRGRRPHYNNHLARHKLQESTCERDLGEVRVICLSLDHHIRKTLKV